jgi:hypothetical protein
MLSRLDLSFYVNKSVVFQYRYKLEVPHGGGVSVNKSLLNWTEWINRDVNEVIIPKLEKEGNYKMVIEYRTHNSNDIGKYEKRFEVYSVTPRNLAITGQSGNEETPEKIDSREKLVAANNRTADIKQVEYQAHSTERDVDHHDNIKNVEIHQANKIEEQTNVSSDIIVKRNGVEIKSKVIEITPDRIRYIDYSRADNPFREIYIAEVHMIKYSNGASEIFPRPEVKDDVQPARRYQEALTTDKGKNSIPRSTTANLNKNDIKQQRKQGGYFSIAAGGGNSYGGLGLSLQYLSRGNMRLGIHGGAGYLPIGVEPAILYAGGVKFYFWDLLYADLQFGCFGTYYKTYWLNLYETASEGGLLFGPSLLLGYDWYFGDHFGINMAAGASYDIGEYLKDFTVAVDFGFVFRF